MNILVTGANGFIGSHLVQALMSAGHKVTPCVRNTRAAQQRWPTLNPVQADYSRDHDASDWVPRLVNIDIVINAVGIIRETGKQTFDALHTQAPIALFRAGKYAGVKRIIQISALGADETALSQYHLSKRAADEFLMALDLEWAIVMPSIVYGPGAKSMALFKALAALPLIPLLDKGNQPIQPIHIDDLTRGILQLTRPEAPSRLRIEMVGPHVITMRDLYSQLRKWLGMGHARYISTPYRMALLAGRLSGFLGKTPMTSETIRMLQKGNTGDVRPFIQLFGFIPLDFQDSLIQTPAQQPDYWYAELYFLKPLLRYSIAFLWMLTAFVSAVIFPVDQSYAMLESAGITGLWAPMMLYGAAVTDLALGLATMLAYRIPLVGLMQIAIITLYTVIITISQPEQWIHPFGPVSKNIPLIIATLIMIVLERKR